MADRDRIVAVGLFTEHELSVVSQGLKRIFPVNDDPSFGELLRAIDAATHCHGNTAQPTSSLR